MNKLPHLPIDDHREEIVRLMEINQVIIVVGETGSGKTTRLPLFMYEDDVCIDEGMIGISEPRRVAATSVARFVAKEMGYPELGESPVGYQVRFDTKAYAETEILFMTDGVLLRGFQEDPLIRAFSVLMIDEAHERNLNSDLLLGLVKQALVSRPDLRVVVASATIDAEKFSRYFDGAPVVSVSGRLHPVDVKYLDRDISTSEGWYPTTKYVVDEAVKTVLRIHASGEPGDVLVFMPGKDEIQATARAVELAGIKDVVVLPIHAGMEPEEQGKIFQNYPVMRKVVVATNIAETSITIDGVVFVVDTGLIKQKNFHPETGIESLDLVKHSRAGCDQRSGRAGRTKPGVCYRLFTEANYTARPQYSVPEILRVSLAGVVLSMEDIGIDPRTFRFIDQPTGTSLQEAYETLVALGAIEEEKKGLTSIGKQMARLPLDPQKARLVLEAEKHGCVKQATMIAAMLSSPGIFIRPSDSRRALEARTVQAEFAHPDSDALSLLNVWRGYKNAGSKAEAWCRAKFINGRSMDEAVKIYKQLVEILENCGVQVSSNEDEDVIRRCLVAGFIYNLIIGAPGLSHAYERVFHQSGGVFIHPSSALFVDPGKLVVPATITRTSKTFAQGCTKAEPDWLEELLPRMFSTQDRIVEENNDLKMAIVLRRYILVRNGRSETVGSKQTTVTFTKARAIQDEMIRDAQSRGWVRVIFTLDGAFGSIVSLEGYEAMADLPTGGVVQFNKPYYCEIVDRTSLGYFVNVKFQEFALGLVLEEPPKKVHSRKPITTVASAPLRIDQDLLSSLQSTLASNMRK